MNPASSPRQYDDTPRGQQDDPAREGIPPRVVRPVSPDTSTIDFGDILPIEIEVRLNGKVYILKEADGGSCAKYRDAITRAAQIGPDNKPIRYDGVAEAELMFLSLCLWESKGKTYRRVSIDVIRSWPNKVIDRLHSKAVEISNMLGDSDNKEKKDNPTSLNGDTEETEDTGDARDSERLDSKDSNETGNGSPNNLRPEVWAKN